jgi:hypothetical protein
MLGALGACMRPPPKLLGAWYFGALNLGCIGLLNPRKPPDSLRAI